MLTLATLGLCVRPWIKVDYWQERAVGRPFRGGLLRSRAVAARVSQPGVRQPESRRRVLGGESGRAVLGRGDSGHRGQGALQRAGRPHTSQIR